MTDMTQILEASRKYFDQIRSLRRELHQFPEIGFDLPKTRTLVCRELAKLPVQLFEDVGGGVVAELVVNPSFPFIALRADMDALPMQEESGLAFASKISGQAHMCGHDAHTAMLLGAARILSEISLHLPYNVRFLFQPNEENQPGGAFSMIEAGCLKNVQEIYGLYVWPGYPVGWFGTKPGPLMAKPDSFTITLRGKGGHASTPQHCIDPILAGSNFVTQAQTILSRQLAPLDAAVLSITSFVSGTTYNVIPDTAILQGTVRTLQPGLSDQIKAAMLRILEGLACSQRICFELDYTEGFPVLCNSREQTEKALERLQYIGATIETNIEPVMGGEDFAHYLEKVPGCFFFLGCGEVRPDGRGYLHNAAFMLQEDCLAYGAAALAAMVLKRE